jgi:hyperosmotically inducible periplasmic protein
MKTLLTMLLAAPLVVGACKARTGENAPNADNTERNGKDRDRNNAVTADQGANHGPDLDLTKEVRRAIVDDGDLSTTAHNVKVIVDNGVVTLAGPVKSMDERQKVEQIAMNVPGTAKVINKLEVKD